MFQSKSPLSVMCKAKNKKIKLKKNALDPVDIEEEKRRDPKYKTEICKSWMENHFCVYGNKCRFAHGYEELVVKAPITNYRKKLCKSFFKNGFCLYGNRCNFKHSDDKKVILPYYLSNLILLRPLALKQSQRLKIFEEISGSKNEGAISESNCCKNDNASESSEDVQTSFNSNSLLLSSSHLSSPNEKIDVCFYPKNYRQTNLNEILVDKINEDNDFDFDCCIGKVLDL